MFEQVFRKKIPNCIFGRDDFVVGELLFVEAIRQTCIVWDGIADKDKPITGHLNLAPFLNTSPNDKIMLKVKKKGKS